MRMTVSRIVVTSTPGTRPKYGPTFAYSMTRRVIVRNGEKTIDASMKKASQPQTLLKWGSGLEARGRPALRPLLRSSAPRAFRAVQLKPSPALRPGESGECLGVLH